ncbi:hypothetical protein MARU1_003088 [Malassezia arunalokei]|uniref:ER membrane protein complex subunit 6 n=1 Tax=Malassezia arunalokei TaxID=1514897 RepID=A0AAJ5Z208_9BASI|nr:hypothetical protein MARU1_003088 [Malassezia arunalokei]
MSAGVTVWDQPHDPESVAHNISQAYGFRSLTLSIAGAIAGVLGLQNLWGFGFFLASVAFVNVMLIAVNTSYKPEQYFVIVPPPVLTTALERLVPSKAEQLRKPQSLIRRAVFLGQWILFQGAQENILSFMLWWTLWFGLVHGMCVFAYGSV